MVKIGDFDKSNFFDWLFWQSYILQTIRNLQKGLGYCVSQKKKTLLNYIGAKLSLFAILNALNYSFSPFAYAAILLFSYWQYTS